MSLNNDRQEKAREKTHDDRRDEWLSCPECGSDDAVVVSVRYTLHAVCPACGHAMQLHAE